MMASSGGLYSKKLVGGRGHYLNRPAEFETSVLGLIREYEAAIEPDR